VYHSTIEADCVARDCAVLGAIRVYHAERESPRDAKGLMLVWFRDENQPMGVTRIENLADGMFLVIPSRLPCQPQVVGIEWMARVKAVEVL
jgi:hypothetical protein